MSKKDVSLWDKNVPQEPSLWDREDDIMANIFDYLQWRGDLTLEQDEFNEIDNLILARFSYLPFDELIKENENVSIEELAKRYKKANIKPEDILWKDDVNLLPALEKAERFKNMIAVKYINKIDEEEEKQFSAITVLMPDDTIYVSYRGTDNTIVGWKEDFNMSFKSHVASQLDSVKYLEEIAKEYPNIKLRVGGHSKGGNLAVYAAVFSNDSVKNRIINVYNNDGPGFSDEIIKLDEYKNMIKKVHTFIPQSSVFGRLLNHEEKYTVLESVQTGIMQHDLYSWQVLGNEFVRVDEITDGSEFVNETIRGWLSKVSPEQREQFIDTIFAILNNTNAHRMHELSENWFVNAKTILKTYKNIDEESKKIITETLFCLFSIAKDNAFAKLQYRGSIVWKKK
ncbi:putative uncharacterized protein [Clostridium sp. CAG:575]|nr:putative uncharacterized protein [Clostridium sp. CAG:575]